MITCITKIVKVEQEVVKHDLSNYIKSQQPEKSYLNRCVVELIGDDVITNHYTLRLTFILYGTSPINH